MYAQRIGTIRERGDHVYQLILVNGQIRWKHLHRRRCNR
jgi:hypothetical protein